MFVEGGSVVVSMQVFTMLLQPVTEPVAVNHPMGPAVPLVRLEYTAPGNYEAFWDGTDRNGRQVSQGMYFLQITVNGVKRMGRMFVAR